VELFLHLHLQVAAFLAAARWQRHLHCQQLHLAGCPASPRLPSRLPPRIHPQATPRLPRRLPPMHSKLSQGLLRPPHLKTLGAET